MKNPHAVALGRMSAGTKAKLTSAQVREIRNARHMSQVELAEKFGVTQGTISHIRSGKTWKWLE